MTQVALPAEFLQAQKRVPNRQQLIDRLDAANRFAWIWVAVQVFVLVTVGWAIDWNRVLSEPLVSTVAIGIMVGPTFMGILRLWAQQKKEIGDLKESTRFGEFDKHRLRMLQRDTLRRLGLPDDHIPVYITASKSLNAGALRLGLGGFFKSLNGIYLHRQVLHKLDAEEVQDIMGHELGHYYRYYLLLDRFRWLTIALGGGLGLWLAQATGMTSFFSVIISSACASLLGMLAGIPAARHGTSIEYLCDDFGAQVHGIDVSINGLLKLGAEAEVQLAIQQQSILSQRSGNLTARQIAEAVESAIPYGHASREEIEKAVESAIELRKQQAKQVTVGGFLQYAWQSDSEAEIDEQMTEQARQLAAMAQFPRLDWESLLPKHQQRFDHATLPHLIDLIESQPQSVLFRLPQEFGQTDDVHPPLKARILYLWHNRQEIERSPRR